jgi:hypothetical protein
VSDLMDKSRTQLATSVMSLVGRKLSKEDQLRSNIEGSTLKKPKFCVYCKNRHPSGKDKCFYL